MPRPFQCFLAFLPLAVSLPAKEAGHWAFAPLEKPSSHCGIDGFVLQKLEGAGLGFSRKESPGRLLRRVYLDVIGIPPSLEERAAWLADPSDANYEKVVDSLLARPQYGERWGRHWLDLARYADTNGLHQDSDRPNAWRYRDYVINSFNEDKPYAQFIREQIAGDELDSDKAENWIATGFCRNGPSNEENVAKNELEAYRLDQMDDVISTISQVFLAQTLACARCHDHKTDPFVQKDYYQLLAVFNTTVPTYVPINENLTLGKPILVPIKQRSKTKLSEGSYARALSDIGLPPKETHLLIRGNHMTPGELVGSGIPSSLSHFPAKFKLPVSPAPTTFGRRLALANWIASPGNPLTWRVMANRIWQHHFGKGIVETASDFGNYGDRPSHPELLDWLACELRDNGGHLKPIHKKILLSKTYRQSSAYKREASSIDPTAKLLWRFPPHRMEAEVIRDSILQASGNLNTEAGGPGIKPRVPSEILEQSKRNTWPKVTNENKEHWRRSVYIYIKRQLPMPMLSLFDTPDPSQTCGARFRSTTPTQSLALLNDEFTNEQARHLAKCVLAGTQNTREAVLEAYLRIFSIAPSKDDLEKAISFVDSRKIAQDGKTDSEKLAIADLAVVLFNSSQFVYAD